jgi:hypothetical protein
MAQCDFELLEGSIATSTPHSPVEPFKSLPTVSDEKIRERILFRRTAWCRCLRMTWILFQELPAKDRLHNVHTCWDELVCAASKK